MLERSHECDPGMTAAAKARDRAWVAVLAASFGFGLAVSWHRWGNPLIDTGREMNQPLRLLAGEMLYSDIRHIYGPLSPWLHAVLFHMFGPSLTVLYTDGIISAIMILALVFWLGHQIIAESGGRRRCDAECHVALRVQTRRSLHPAYTYNSLHGHTLGLITLAILTAALKRGREAAHPLSVTPFLLAGIVSGLSDPVQER